MTDRVLQCVDRVLTEFASRELGHADAGALIEDIRQRLREDLLMLQSDTKPILELLRGGR